MKKKLSVWEENYRSYGQPWPKVKRKHTTARKSVFPASGEVKWDRPPADIKKHTTARKSKKKG